MIVKYLNLRLPKICAAVAILAVLFALVAPATPAGAAVLSEDRYEQRIDLQCVGNTCTGHTFTPALKRRIIVKNISCNLIAPATAVFDFGDVYVLDPANSKTLFQQFLIPGFRNSYGDWVLNQATEFAIGATRVGVIRLATKPIVGNPTSAICSLSGVKQTLQ